MGWSRTAKPTAANIRKRIDAATDAIEAALYLVGRYEGTGDMGRAVVPMNYARSWLADARKRTMRGK